MNGLKRIIGDMQYAIKYGVNEAILLDQIIYWLQTNAANEQHFHDGRTWMYNSRKAWIELLPCFTEKQIRKILDSLVEQKVIMKGNFNKVSFDRTGWYALCDEDSFLGNSIGPKGPMRTAQKGQSERPEKADLYQDITKKDNQDNNTSPSLKEKNAKYLPIAEYLRDKIKATGTEGVFKSSDLNGWADDFRLMVMQDGRTEDQIIAKIDAVFSDHFWKKVIRSADKLRKQWKAGKLDRLGSQEQSDRSESDDYQEPEKKQPKTLWERFIGRSEYTPAEQVHTWIGDLWEQFYGNKDWILYNWPNPCSKTNEEYHRMFDILVANKEDRKAGLEVIIKEFGLIKVDNEY